MLERRWCPELMSRRTSGTQHGSPAGVSTGGAKTASGDAKASVVSRRVPMPVGIKTDKTGGKK